MPKKQPVWTYRLRDPLVWKTGIAPNFGQWQYDTVFFTDDRDKLWLSIGIDGTITIESGYAWDGCSPKWQLGWLQFGTPDGAPNPATGYPYTYAASCIHDALCQFADAPYMPYTREQIDQIFRERLVAEGFPAARLYYRAVRLYSRWLELKRKFPRIGL